MTKIRHNAPLQEFERNPRKTRNFADMKVNSIQDITDAEDWTGAAKSAHDYAAKQTPKWKMQTKWNPEKNFGRIRRIA